MTCRPAEIHGLQKLSRDGGIGPIKAVRGCVLAECKNVSVHSVGEQILRGFCDGNVEELGGSRFLRVGLPAP